MAYRHRSCSNLKVKPRTLLILGKTGTGEGKRLQTLRYEAPRLAISACGPEFCFVRESEWFVRFRGRIGDRRFRNDGCASTQKEGYLSGFLPQVSRAGFAVGLRGSAEVLAYFSLACSLLRTTLQLLVQLIGLPLCFIGLCAFGRHASFSHRLGLIPSPCQISQTDGRPPLNRSRSRCGASVR